MSTQTPIDPRSVHGFRSKITTVDSVDEIEISIHEIAALMAYPLEKLIDEVERTYKEPYRVSHIYRDNVIYLNEKEFGFLFTYYAPPLKVQTFDRFRKLKAQETAAILAEGAWRGPDDTPEFAAWWESNQMMMRLGGDEQDAAQLEVNRLKKVWQRTAEYRASRILEDDPQAASSEECLEVSRISGKAANKAEANRRYQEKVNPPKSLDVRRANKDVDADLTPEQIAKREANRKAYDKRKQKSSPD